MRHRVVIVGGGFGGLRTAMALGRGDVRVTLIDRRNFHLFQPLLYQVATGGLSPANIAGALRAILRRQSNTEVLMGEVVDIDVQSRRVALTDGHVEYDTLVLAAGATHSYFGHSDWERFAPGLKTIEDALEIRRRIFTAFELAERAPDAQTRDALLTFVVVGAGPTGVELAGAIGEIAHYALKKDFCRIDPSQARIFLVEGSDRVLRAYPEDLSEKAMQSLVRLKITPLVHSTVTNISAEGVALSHLDGRHEEIRCRTVVWAAGVSASSLGRILQDRAGATIDRAGRVEVGPDLCLPSDPRIFVIGDMALVRNVEGQPLPGVAPVAMQQGHYVGRLILARLRGESLGPFVYWDKGNMATIGRAAAVAQIGRWRFSGLIAWLLWLFVHLMFLISFENRFLVLFQWAWNYITHSRTARLITGVDTSATTIGPSKSIPDASSPMSLSGSAPQKDGR